MLAVILPIHQLVFEVDVAEQPELLPLPELAVSSTFSAQNNDAA